MSKHRWAMVAVLWACSGWACSGSSGEVTVRVDLRTDLLPGVEFDGATIFVGGGDTGESISHVALATSDYVRGVRLGQFDTLPGDVRLRAVLYQAGRPLVEREVIAAIAGPRTLTVVITRDCRGVMCPVPGGDARASACLGGQCEDPRCTPETPEFCTVDRCTTPADCERGCASGTCVTGVCLYSPDDSACAADERCDFEAGCVPAATFDAGTSDAGPSDGGADVGDSGNDSTVEAFDAGTLDAGPVSCPESWPPPQGACNIQLQTGCAPAEKCELQVGTLETQCLPDDSRRAGDTCMFGQCRAGLTCSFLGLGGGTPRCRPLCADGLNCTCPDPSDHCFVSPGTYGACAETGCDPVANTGCPTGQACVLANNQTTCVDRPGTAGAGTACVSGFDCALGNVCIVAGTTRCFQICRVVDDACGCRALTSDGVYGYCTL